MREEKRKGEKRIILSSELAQEIYRYKVDFVPSSFKSCLQASLGRTLRGESGKVAKKYGVSPKTVRDIWNHKSWVNATEHLWKDPKNQQVDYINYRRIRRCTKL